MDTLLELLPHEPLYLNLLQINIFIDMNDLELAEDFLNSLLRKLRYSKGWKKSKNWKDSKETSINIFTHVAKYGK
jgi:pyruvate formate-lyase activating enzyme-like uncharacterized protein